MEKWAVFYNGRTKPKKITDWMNQEEATDFALDWTKRHPACEVYLQKFRDLRQSRPVYKDGRCTGFMIGQEQTEQIQKRLARVF